MDVKNKRILAKFFSSKTTYIKMKNLLRLIILIFILQSCVTSKSALKNFNNAEYNGAAEKYNQIVKDDPKTNFLLAESYQI